MKPCIPRLLSALTISLSLLTAFAENWPHWRGPFFSGSSPEKKLPTEFSLTNGVKWTASLPGPSAATPIIWEDQVFVSSTDSQTRSLRAIAIDRKTGKELWNHKIAEALGQDRRSNFASPSPVTDGERVYFFYGSGDLVAFDFAGNQLWARNIQKEYGQFAFNWTFSTSPTLADGKLIMQVLQRDVPVNGRGRTDGPNDSYLLALNPKSGKEIWKQVRPSDARAESRESFATPVPVAHGGSAQLLVAGGDCISGHNLESGEELWRWGTWNPKRITYWRLVPTPVTGEGVVLACAPTGAPVYAIKLGKTGELDDSAVAWISSDREVSTDVSTPAFYQGRFYVLNGDKKTIARVDPATGKADWIGDLGTRVKFEASPTVADGKIYVQNFNGEVFVIAAADEFKILHMAAMGDEGDKDNRGSIAVSQGDLFIRTGGKLHCVGK